MPLLVKGQRNEEWLTARSGRITASLAAACLGLDKKTGPYSAFQEIMGRHKKKVYQAMQWGTDHEQACISAYEVVSGNIVQPTGFWVHPELPWLGASPDGFVGKDGLCETKCPGRLPVEVPGHHLIQMAVQMAVCDRAWCDYFCRDPQEQTFLRRMHRDKEAEGKLIFKLFEFYQLHIKCDVPPPRRRKKEAVCASAKSASVSSPTT